MHLLERVAIEERYIRASLQRNTDLHMQHINAEGTACSLLVNNAIELGARGIVPVYVHVAYSLKYKSKYTMTPGMFLVMPFGVALLSLLCFVLGGFFEKNLTAAIVTAGMSGGIALVGEVIRQFSGMSKELTRMRAFNQRAGELNTKLTCANLLMLDFVAGYKKATTFEKLTENVEQYSTLFTMFDEAHLGVEEELNHFRS